MTERGNLELIIKESDANVRPTSTEPGLDTSALHASAVRLARTLAWIPGERESRDFGERCQKLTVVVSVPTRRARRSGRRNCFGRFSVLFTRIRSYFVENSNLPALLSVFPIRFRR